VQGSPIETVEALGYYEQVKNLSRQVTKVCLSDAKYALSFLAVFVSRPVSILFTLYSLMWIVSFVGTGTVKSDEEAQKIY